MYINFLAYNFCQKLIIEINLLIKPMYTEARMFLQHITEYRISNEEKDTPCGCRGKRIKKYSGKIKLKYTYAQKILLTAIYITVYTIHRRGGALL